MSRQEVFADDWLYGMHRHSCLFVLHPPVLIIAIDSIMAMRRRLLDTILRVMPDGWALGLWILEVSPPFLPSECGSVGADRPPCSFEGPLCSDRLLQLIALTLSCVCFPAAIFLQIGDAKTQQLIATSAVVALLGFLVTSRLVPKVPGQLHP